MEQTGEEGSQQQNNKSEKKKLIQIPSYQEVFGGTTVSTSSTSSYNPSPPASFSEAFSFVKSTEFYTPPPPPSQPETTPRDTGAGSASTPSTFASGSGVGQNRNAILVSHRQKGNPLLKHIRNVKWVFADIVCDYMLGPSSCALYISLRYHLLHPDYLYYRIRELQKNFKLRVILCHVDLEDVLKPLQEVTKTALLHDCTLLCAWSLEECGRYLETIKVYENKPADIIREQTDTDYMSRLTHALTSIRHINKTDVVTLGSSFGSLSQVMNASMEELARCPGIGEKKVKRLYDTFHEPFKRVPARPNIIIPDTPDRDANKGQPSSATDGADSGKDLQSSESRKDSSVSVRSALSAAFAKYNERVQNRGTKRNLRPIGEASGNNSDEVSKEDQAK
ncbi:DNA excision repair protein ERCC-1 [Rhynchospora pubera]|uniref:DNA excision repair protein ERCC-1 n=1 Tax=Rhynchospora pubera TaxID=906938 RepID=A0AAV8E0A8_9POAL|nr:DNA excision repair protein ERCC-1 [Rhynchospora pubera]